jgi:hypothetical protein
LLGNLGPELVAKDHDEVEWDAQIYKVAC